LPWAGLPLRGQEKSKSVENAPKKNVTPAPTVVEIRLTDDSTMKIVLRDEKIELETGYGKLLIPAADIERIDVGLRISDSDRKRIDTAIADLGSADFRRRKTASDELIALKEKAYAVLSRAAKSKDAETTRRFDEILDKIREQVAAEILETPLTDVVQTADSKIAGKIKADVLRVSTLAFGEQQVKLTDIRSLRSQTVRDAEPAGENVLLDPNALHMYANQAGKKLTFKLTAMPAGQQQFGLRMGVFGTDVYTIDSSLEGAAIHAGVLQPGKTGIVHVTMVGQHPAFQPSLRNGVASQPWGAWQGFRIEKARGGQPKN
jgi:hypothetical protein